MKYDYTGLCLFDHVLQVASEGKKNPPSAFSASKQASLAWLVPWIGCSSRNKILIRGRLLTRLLSYVENLPTGNVQFRSTLNFHFVFLFWVSNCVLQLGLFAFDFKEGKNVKMTTSEDTPDKRRDFSDNYDSDTEGKNSSSDETGNSSPQHRQELGTTDSPTTTMPSSQLERVSDTLHDQPNQTNEMNNESQVNNKNDKKVTRGTFSHEFNGTSVGAYDDSTDNFKIQTAGKTTNHLQEQESQQQEPDSVVDSSGASSSLPISESIDLASPLSETVTDNVSMQGTPPISYLSSGQPHVLPNAGMIQQSPQIVKSTESDTSILSSQQMPPPQFIPNMRYNGAPATVDIPQVPQIVIPTVQRHAMPPTHINGNLNAHINNGYYLPQNYQQMQPMTQISVGGGKRKIHLRLMEDVPKPKGKKVSFLSFGKGKRGRILSAPLLTSPKGDEKKEEIIQQDFLDRGRMTVSWYEGTTSLELYQHVRNSVIRKLNLHGTAKLGDLRILDEAFDPPEGTYVCKKTMLF